MSAVLNVHTVIVVFYVDVPGCYQSVTQILHHVRYICSGSYLISRVDYYWHCAQWVVYLKVVNV